MIAKALAHEPSILFLDEPTAGVDVELRRDMWRIVRTLRDAGVTIILTTHYIEEAEELADRIGVINKGALILVEEKDVLMRKLGKKQLILSLREPVDAIPDGLAGYALQLSPDKRELTYTYDAQSESSGVKPLFQALDATGLAYKDVQTKVSSLEEIFVDIVRAGA
jgi:ABC-2 type transport system ATP-binding protein